MSVSLQALQERIDSATSLKSIVETMRTLAMVNIRRAEQAVAATVEYQRSVHLALHVVLRHVWKVSPMKQKVMGEKVTFVVLASNQGLCGQFNERIVDFASNLCHDAKRQGLVPQVISVGYRGAVRMETRGWPIIASLDAPTSVEAIAAVVRRVHLAIGDVIGRPEHERVVVVHNRLTGTSAFDPWAFDLLPFDATKWRSLPPDEVPFRTVPQAPGSVEELLGHLVPELLFIDLYRALADSFAAENAARLASMQGAADNLEDQLEQLEAAYREARQDAITHEMMDMVSATLATEG